MLVISQQDQYLYFAISLSNSIRSLEVVNSQYSNYFSKEALKLILKTTALFHYYLFYKKLLKSLFSKNTGSFKERSNSSQIPIWFSKILYYNICLRNVTDKITTGLEKDLFTGMILVELQQGLETIDHRIWMQKMTYLDFLKNAIAWLKLYFSERNYKTNIRTSYSSTTNLICGVLQGFILGPFLFLLYLIDLLQAIVRYQFLYADDTCIVS